eukprot:tig00021603_g22810.t1
MTSLSRDPGEGLPRALSARKKKARFSIDENKHLRSDNFTRLRLLGQGDVGKVYLVSLKGTSKLYAMKVLDKSEMLKRSKLKRVMVERDILAAADHPFIARLYGSFQSKQKIYFLLEYCAGGDLFKLLQKQPTRRFPESTARFYASEATAFLSPLRICSSGLLIAAGRQGAQVVLALEFLHILGFMYRDLKPENILVHESGHIMLTDFDLSKESPKLAPRVLAAHVKEVLGCATRRERRRNSTGSFSRSPMEKAERIVENSHSFVGTPDYLAPEVIKGSGHDVSVDWWSLGILIYEMVFGFPPFGGTSLKEKCSNILQQELVMPDIPSVSEDCRDLITRLLRLDPKERLGYSNDAIEIKGHPWFKSVKWALVRNQRPPIIPHHAFPEDSWDVGTRYN